MRTFLAVLSVLVSVSGCASTGGAANPFDEEGSAAGEETVRLLVDNRAFSDARLTALIDGRRRSVGSSSGLSQDAFVIPFAGATRLQIEINQIGGRRFTTRPVSLAPGQTVELIVSAEISQSRLTPRGGGLDQPD